MDAINKGFQSAPNGDFLQETAQWIVYRAHFRRWVLQGVSPVNGCPVRHERTKEKARRKKKKGKDK